MSRFIYIILLIFTLTFCKEEKTDLSGEAVIVPSKFKSSFNSINLPIEINNKNLNILTNTKPISLNVLKQFIPDSIVNVLSTNKLKKIIIMPIGKIEKEKEWYLVLNFIFPNYKDLVVVAFDEKNKFINYIKLANFHNPKNNYQTQITINKEPTFTVKEKSLTLNVLNSSQIISYALIDNQFSIILKELQNTIIKKNNIENPIDTLPDLNALSGDYYKENQILSLRDGNDKNAYKFYLNMNNSENKCTGEINGEIKIQKNKAEFKTKNDPCMLNFILTDNSIKIKELGQCGNKRSYECNFNGIYYKNYTKKHNQLKKNQKLKIKSKINNII